MSQLSELGLSGAQDSREPFPAETANRWVNQQGPVLLEDHNYRPRSIHDLYGEYQEKSQFFLVQDPQKFWVTRLVGAVPQVVSRQQTRHSPYGSVEPFGVKTFIRYFWMSKGLQAMRLPSMENFDGNWVNYTEEGFRADFDLSPYEAQRWIEENARGLKLRSLEPQSPLEQEVVSDRLFSFVNYEPLSVVELSSEEEQERKRGRGRVVLAALGGFGTVLVAASACVPAQEISPTVPASRPTASEAGSSRPTSVHTPEAPTPTLLPGGPDDRLVNGSVLPWPSSISSIPALRADGGPFTFDVEAANVQAQLDAVLGYLGGWTVVTTPDQLTAGRTVFVAPFQDSDQWSIQALTLDGVMVPVRLDVSGNGIVMDRPDWATGEVAGYQELEHGLGSEFPTKFELVNGHWVPVVRDSSGRRVGFFDVNSQAFLYEAQYLVQIEARATHPSEVSTWPAEYQAYFSDPWRYSGMEIEREADQFIAESRRALFSRLASEDPELVASVVNYMRADGLLSNGGFRPIQAVEQMSAEELLWATIILNAETQEATVLTPNEIRGIMGDGDAVVWRWTEVKDGTYIRHGMWHDFSASAPDESLFEAFSNFSYEMEVFGSRVTVPHYASHVYTGGRLVGIVELPGGVGTGILLAYKDQGGGMHLQVYHAIDWGKSVQFDETMELCVGSVSMPSDLGQTKMLCPNTEVRTILQRGTNYMNAPRVQDRLSPAWLAWPGYPAKVAFGAVSYYHRAYQAPSTVLTFHHPDSGIEIVRQLTVDFPSDKP